MEEENNYREESEFNEAEIAATEVLHSLLSVERLHNPINHPDHATNTQHELQTVQATSHQLDENPTLEVSQSELEISSQQSDGVGEKTTPKKAKKKEALHDSIKMVEKRFKKGCECLAENCFADIDPESVYKHRINISRLTKEEHDMYLMGVSMASIPDPHTTTKYEEKRRLRMQYVYHGHRVCIDAFLYLENCTQYQMKSIRKHLKTYGVSRRTHGNIGKKPHNKLQLDVIYPLATKFLKEFMKKCKEDNTSVTAFGLYDAYKTHATESGQQVMGVHSFKQFLKTQFPDLKIKKRDIRARDEQEAPSCDPEMEQQVEFFEPVQELDLSELVSDDSFVTTEHDVDESEVEVYTTEYRYDHV